MMLLTTTPFSVCSAQRRSFSAAALSVITQFGVALVAASIQQEWLQLLIWRTDGRTDDILCFWDVPISSCWLNCTPPRKQPACLHVAAEAA